MSLFRLKMEDPSSAHEKAIVYARCRGPHQMASIKFAEYQWEHHVSPGYKYVLKIYDSYMQLTPDGLYCSDLKTKSYGMYPLFANRTYHMANRGSALYSKYQYLHRWWFPEEDPPALPEFLYV